MGTKKKRNSSTFQLVVNQNPCEKTNSTYMPINKGNQKCTFFTQLREKNFFVAHNID